MLTKRFGSEALSRYHGALAFRLGLGTGHMGNVGYIVVSLIAMLFIAILVMERPDPAATSQPWYMIPGFVVTVPAVPLIMPFLLGVVLLRRAGNEQR